MKTFFCNRTVDKGEMKRLIKWVLLNYGTEKTTRLIDQLKTMGFHYATYAGISLGIDDLRIPPIKSTFLKNAEQDIYENDLRLQRGQITSVQRLEKALDIWNTTNDTLKTEVVKHFRSTDIFNPVYMMAFSGARGNISQVRQLVGMRGLTADPQGQILDFPIRRNFREGLTVTEYMISCYGARKGLVDTALRTASSGYLTRRLVDVAQSVIIQQVDCQTNQGLKIVPDPKQIESQLIGRVLFENVIDVETGRIIGLKNQDISPALALKLVKQPTLIVRSPLTCKFHAVCQLCYGWNLAQQKLVQLGEAVGVLAAQSIGEPGTQLTMRTFHTGGVFAGEATEKVYAPHEGKIFYSQKPRGRKILSKYGETAFLTFDSLQIKISGVEKTSIFTFPPFTVLYFAPGDFIYYNQGLAELSRLENKRAVQEFDETVENVKKPFFSNKEGQIYLPESYDGKNYSEMWVLGSSITSTKTLVPGDNIKPFIYPVKTKSTTEFLKSKNSLATQFTYLNSKLDLKNTLQSKEVETVKNTTKNEIWALPKDKRDFLRVYDFELTKQKLKIDRSKSTIVAMPSVKIKLNVKSLKFKSVVNINGCTDNNSDNRIRSRLPIDRWNSTKVGSVGTPLAINSIHSNSFNPLNSQIVNSVYRNNIVTASYSHLSALKPNISKINVNANFLPLPTNLGIQKLESTYSNGIFAPFKVAYHHIGAIKVGNIADLTQTDVFGEVRASNSVLTSTHQQTFNISSTALKVKIGDYARLEDQLTDLYRLPQSGQINFINISKTMIRSVQPYLLVPGSELAVGQGSLVQPETVLGTLASSESKAGDIVQGLPKVDELLEAREPQHKLSTSIHAKLSTLFYQYGKMYGLREGCELSFQKIRQILVQEVQDVYQSQGVYIGDKHVEIIVRQMTTHVVVVDPGKTGLLPGDIIDIRRIQQLEKNGLFAGVKYRPILLGITRAALMAESFISAASFQETKRVLANAALEGQIDWLTGLKENVILGRLIPAGTGLY
jgi:hypothetical protein